MVPLLSPLFVEVQAHAAVEQLDGLVQVPGEVRPGYPLYAPLYHIYYRPPPPQRQGKYPLPRGKFRFPPVSQEKKALPQREGLFLMYAYFIPAVMMAIL